MDNMLAMRVGIYAILILSFLTFTRRRSSPQGEMIFGYTFFVHFSQDTDHSD